MADEGPLRVAEHGVDVFKKVFVENAVVGLPFLDAGFFPGWCEVEPDLVSIGSNDSLIQQHHAMIGPITFGGIDDEGVSAVGYDAQAFPQDFLIQRYRPDTGCVDHKIRGLGRC